MPNVHHLNTYNPSVIEGFFFTAKGVEIELNRAKQVNGQAC